MRVPFVGSSNTARSVHANAQRTVNAYLELDNSNPRVPVALYGTPGMVRRLTLPKSPVRGCIAMGEYSYWIAGNTVYRVSSDYAVKKLGTIGSSTGDVSMAHNGTQVAIVDGTGGWLASVSDLDRIDDEEFPNRVTRVTSQDGYFLFTGDESEKFYINETPRNGAVYAGTDFASAEGSPDFTLGLISDHRELWLFGSESAEMWPNTGNPDFPFERSQSIFVEQGCAAGGSIAAMDNTIYWLGKNKNGQGIVFKMQGYTPMRVSNHALESELESYDTIADARAFCFQMGGHAFYVLVFPSADKTWLYDASTGEWIEWAWTDPDTNEEHRHRANCCVFFSGKHLIGDWESGKVYSLEREVYTDDGEPIKRLRRTQTMADDNASVFLFYSNLVVDMETGLGLPADGDPDPQVMLRYWDMEKKDTPWSNLKTRPIGQRGRVKFAGNLGTSKKRIWELSMTSPVKFVLLGATVDVQKGKR